MKTPTPKLLLLAFGFLFLAFSCKKKPNENPIDDLPPITQTGANSFGCLVNGKAFIPRAGFGQSPYQCFYQFVDGEYYFSVSATKRPKKSEELSFIAVASNRLKISQNMFIIRLGQPGEIGAIYSFSSSPDTSSVDYKTNNSITGELNITKLDEQKQIVSGTFWFDAVNDKGEKVEVREGRFDMQYTR